MDERRRIVAAGYDAMAAKYGAWSTQVVGDPRHRLLDEFARRLPDGAKVLDLGCGAGVPSTARLAERFDVVGVDISKAQLELARQNVPQATFIHAELGSLDLAPESFDGITAFYSIAHVPRAEHADLFRRIRTWLKPGGLFLATLSATDGEDWVGDWLGVEMFFSGFDAETNRGLLGDAGFTVLVDEIVTAEEPEGPATFLWVICSPAD